MQFLPSFCTILFVSIHVLYPYIRIDTSAAWKKLHFIFLDRLDFHIIDNLSITYLIDKKKIYIYIYIYIKIVFCMSSHTQEL